MQRLLAVGLMALRTLLLIDGVATHLRGRQFAQGLRRRQVMATHEEYHARHCGDPE